jgi:hypothetical protein
MTDRDIQIQLYRDLSAAYKTSTTALNKALTAAYKKAADSMSVAPVPTPTPDPVPVPVPTPTAGFGPMVWLGYPDLDAPDNYYANWISSGCSVSFQTGRLSYLGGDYPNPYYQQSFKDWMVKQGIPANKMSIGFYFASDLPTPCPLADPFNDVDWTNRVYPAVQQIADLTAFVGSTRVLIDSELSYAQKDSSGWNWDYPGNTHSEAETRAKWRERFRRIGDILSAKVPNVHVTWYTSTETCFPNSYLSEVQRVVNGLQNMGVKSTLPDMVNGLSSSPGVKTVAMSEGCMQKSMHLPGMTWDQAMKKAKTLQRTFVNSYMANPSKVLWVPMLWTDPGQTPYEAAVFSVAQETERFKAAKVNSEDQWDWYGHHSSDGQFDYGPYLNMLKTI